MVLDFEGEPARSLPERRRKRSPLRDVAGMLRSFAYAAQAAPILRGVEAPEGWEERCRRHFSTVPRRRGRVAPAPRASGRWRLLSVFELEKAVYELRYELSMRPDWVDIPVAGILRILESELMANSASSTCTSPARAATSASTSSSGRMPSRVAPFAVWAPNARDVSVVGDWNGWDGRVDRLEPAGSSGIWHGLVPRPPPRARATSSRSSARTATCA